MTKQRFLEIKSDAPEGSFIIDMEKILYVVYDKKSDEISIYCMDNFRTNPLVHGAELLAQILQYGETKIGRDN